MSTSAKEVKPTSALLFDYKKIIAAIEEAKQSDVANTRIDEKKDSLPTAGAKTDIDNDADSMPKKLSRMLSALYLKTAKKMCVDQIYVDEIMQCGNVRPYSAKEQLLEDDVGPNLVLALKTKNYSTLAHIVVSVCHLGQFPTLSDSNILSMLTELMLCIGTKEKDGTDYRVFEDSFERLVRHFPPNLMAMRPNYVQFLEQPLDPIRLTGIVSSEEPKASKKLFETLHELLDETLENYNATKVGIRGEAVEIPMPLRKSILDNAFQEPSPVDRLERLMAVLRQLVQMLELDLTLWLLQQGTDTNFDKDNAPLTVVLFAFPEAVDGKRLTNEVKNTFMLFAKATAKGLPRHYLQILERFVALAITTSNTADFERNVDGLRYPYVSAKTKDLIRAFYEIFCNHVDILSLLEVFDASLMLHIPYVRYQFNDLFLRTFDLAGDDDMSPQKIHDEIKHSRNTPTTASADRTRGEKIMWTLRLQLLLIALRDYCDWHGTDDYMQQIGQKAPVRNFQTRSISRHHDSTLGSGEPLQLEQMEKDIELLMEGISLDECVQTPLADMPSSSVSVDTMTMLKYETDRKYMVLLYAHVMESAILCPDIDYSDWLELLQPLAVGQPR